MIDSTLEPGSLTYGECVLPGEPDEEVLSTTHVCHPSLANDNLSGHRARHGARRRARRAPAAAARIGLLFIPGTIGSITWLARNEDALARVVGGLVIACVGDAGPLTYKRSRRGDARIDRAVAHVVGRGGRRRVSIRALGLRRASVQLAGLRSPRRLAHAGPCEGEFPEYHTSADDLDFIRPEQLEGALDAMLDDRRRPRADRTFREPLAERRAAARQARPVSGARGPRSRQGTARIALGPQPVGRRPFVARHRGALRPLLRSRSLGGRRPPGIRAYGGKRLSGALVTGASGFIGGNLCRRLVAADIETHAVSRCPPNDEGGRWWQVDLTDAEAVKSLFERVRPDVVHHLAGHVSGSRNVEGLTDGRHVTVVTSTYQIASWGYSVQAPDGTVTTTFKRYGGKQQTQEIFGCSTTVGNETWHLSNR